MPGRVKEYITLTTAIKSDGTTAQKQRNDTQQATIGCVKGRTLINFEDIFVEMKDEISPVKLILVSGAPGIGKSTFAWEVCRQWYNRNIDTLNHFTLVIFINLGDKHVQEARDIAQLLDNGIGSDLAKLPAQYAENVKGKGILFILDGFDELPPGYQRESLPVKLIQGKCLNQATILVTSRPSALKEFRTVCGIQEMKHIEVLGFLQKEIDTYGEKAFDGETQCDFKTFIRGNPIVKGLMTYPLNALFITEIYRDRVSEGNPIPKNLTLTCLYCLLMQCLVKRKHEVFTNQPDNVPYDNKKYIQELKHLGKIAFDKLQERDSKIFFSELPEGCSNLMGLLNKVESHVSVTYNFLHQTLQEYLGAYYIKELSAQEQAALFSKHGKDKNLGGIWAFVAGLTQMRDLGWDGFKERYSAQEDVTNVDPYFAQCLYEAHDGAIVQKVFGNSKVKYGHQKLSLPFDAYAIGWCISVSKNICDVDLGWNACGPEMVEMLTCGLQQAKNCHLEKLDISWNRLKDEGMLHFKSMPHCVLNNISSLNIADCQINNEGLDTLAQAIPSMAQLSELNIAGNRGSKMNLFRELQKHSTIKDLNAVNTGMSPNDAIELYVLVQNSQSLEQLVIGEENRDISPVYLQSLLMTTSLPSGLRKLTIFIPQDISPLSDLTSVSNNFEEMEPKSVKRNKRVVHILVLSSRKVQQKCIWRPTHIPKMIKYKML